MSIDFESLRTRCRWISSPSGRDVGRHRAPRGSMPKRDRVPRHSIEIEIESRGTRCRSEASSEALDVGLGVAFGHRGRGAWGLSEKSRAFHARIGRALSFSLLRPIATRLSCGRWSRGCRRPGPAVCSRRWTACRWSGPRRRRRSRTASRGTSRSSCAGGACAEGLLAEGAAGLYGLGSGRQLDARLARIVGAALLGVSNCRQGAPHPRWKVLEQLLAPSPSYQRFRCYDVGSPPPPSETADYSLAASGFHPRRTPQLFGARRAAFRGQHVQPIALWLSICHDTGRPDAPQIKDLLLSWRAGN